MSSSDIESSIPAPASFPRAAVLTLCMAARNAEAFLDRCFGNEHEAPWRNVEASGVRGGLQASLGSVLASQPSQDLDLVEFQTALGSDSSAIVASSSSMSKLLCSVCGGLGLVGTPPARCSFCDLSAFTRAAPDMAPESIASTISGPESTMGETRNEKLTEAILRKMGPYVAAYSQRALALGEMVRQIGPERALDPTHDALVARRYEELKSMIVSALAQAETE